MADENKKDTRTEDEVREAKIDYSDEEIQQGVKLINDQGYITKKDMDQMKDPVWANGFEKKVDAQLHDDDEDPYLYVEKFDFKGGKIDSIIFNMDTVKSRDDALKILSRVTGEKIVR